jgi:hypothetical protein
MKPLVQAPLVQFARSCKIFILGTFTTFSQGTFLGARSGLTFARCPAQLLQGAMERSGFAGVL